MSVSSLFTALCIYGVDSKLIVFWFVDTFSSYMYPIPTGPTCISRPLPQFLTLVINFKIFQEDNYLLFLVHRIIRNNHD